MFSPAEQSGRPVGRPHGNPRAWCLHRMRPGRLQAGGAGPAGTGARGGDAVRPQAQEAWWRLVRGRAFPFLALVGQKQIKSRALCVLSGKKGEGSAHQVPALCIHVHLLHSEPSVSPGGDHGEGAGGSGILSSSCSQSRWETEMAVKGPHQSVKHPERRQN